ncbi:hypothetical protein SAY86_008953 [Trapa natans]|uniref:RING-type domain-containing protein n=1 Tax=Trapa natans TaxID=22666 RepID=A0AAN7K9J5_TRANT|nr:hypothetical protein SAY86_008953 [Trapa natans]
MEETLLIKKRPLTYGDDEGAIHISVAAASLSPWRRRLRSFSEEVKRVGYLAGPMVAVSFSQYMLQVISIMMVGHLDQLALSSTAIAVSLTGVTGFSLLIQKTIPSLHCNVQPLKNMYQALEWWSYELLILLSGLLPNPKLETSVLAVCLSTISTLYTIPYGVGAAGSTRVSNELGAGNPGLARLAVYATMFLSVIEMSIMSTSLFIGRRAFGYIFSDNKEVVDYVTRMAPLVCISVILDSLQGCLSAASCLLLSFGGESSFESESRAMGVQTHLNDVASDSILLLLLSLLAACYGHLSSFFSAAIRFLAPDGISAAPSPQLRIGHDGDVPALTSLYSGLLALADLLNVNPAISDRFSGNAASDHQNECIVCLCALNDGDRVRRLPCRHVFHRACFDSWLDCRNFNCPLCRSPLVSAEQLGAALVAWISRR